MSETSETLQEAAQPERPRQLDRPPWWDEIGARSLAFAGGGVTLLGVLLLYLFASRAGWIGPGLRVAFGIVFSAALLTAAPLVRRRYGQSHASDVTAGVGLATAYVTLLAASALYGFLSPAPALLLGLAIAAGGVLLAAGWGSEAIAAFAILGAVFTPGLAEGRMTDVGSLFVGLLYAAAAALMVMRRWWRLAAATAACVAVETATLLALDPVDVHARLDPDTVIGTAAVAGLTLLAGYGYARRTRGGRVPDQALAAILLAAGVAGAGSFLVMPGELLGRSAAGLGLLVSGLVLCALMARCLGTARRRRHERDLASVLGACGLVLAGVGTGEVLHGLLRVAAFAALAVGMAWLARRLAEERFTWAALAHLGVAGTFALVLEAPPVLLMRADAGTLHGVASVAILVVAAGACLTGSSRPAWAPAAFWTTVAAAIYAGSLLALGLFEQGQSGQALQTAFAHGQTAVSALWGLAGLALLSLGLSRRQRAFRYAGLLLFGAALAKLFALDLQSLDSISRALSFLAVGVVLMAAGLVYQRLTERVGLGSGA